MSRQFPKEERYALTDQILRSSRSVCANLAESYAKRRYPKHFIAKLTDASAENYETQAWMLFALDHGYIQEEHFRKYQEACDEIGKLLSFMQRYPEKFTGSPI